MSDDLELDFDDLGDVVEVVEPSEGSNIPKYFLNNKPLDQVSKDEILEWFMKVLPQIDIKEMENEICRGENIEISLVENAIDNTATFYYNFARMLPKKHSVQERIAQA